MNNHIYDLSDVQNVNELIKRLTKESNFLEKKHAFAFGNVVKYVIRSPRKGRLDDLKKAADYLNDLISDFETTHKEYVWENDKVNIVNELKDE